MRIMLKAATVITIIRH